jgi:hypothetical protein
LDVAINLCWSLRYAATLGGVPLGFPYNFTKAEQLLVKLRNGLGLAEAFCGFAGYLFAALICHAC